MGITFPIQIISKNLEKVEKALNIAVNIYSYDIEGAEYIRYPVYNTKRNDIKPINLLYFSTDEND